MFSSDIYDVSGFNCFPLCRSAFFVFCAEYRPTVKSENPNLSIGETAKKLGELWSKQSISDRVPFEQKAVKLREKYEKVSRGFTVMFN